MVQQVLQVLLALPVQQVLLVQLEQTVQPE
jgi:hypothetical protein